MHLGKLVAKSVTFALYDKRVNPNKVIWFSIMFLLRWLRRKLNHGFGSATDLVEHKQGKHEHYNCGCEPCGGGSVIRICLD